MNKYDTMTAY